MYDIEQEFLPSAPQPAAAAVFDASEIADLSSLMRELRDLTQSRRTFAATCVFLRRLGAETESPRLVAADVLDR